MTGEQYFFASLDHLERSNWASKQDSNIDWRMIHWNAGLSVECLLRSVVNEPVEQRTPKHSLYFWVKCPQVAQILSYSQEVGGQIGSELSLLWRSEDRYLTDFEYDARLKKRLLSLAPREKFDNKSATEYCARKLFREAARLSSIIGKSRKNKAR